MIDPTRTWCTLHSNFGKEKPDLIFLDIKIELRFSPPFLGTFRSTLYQLQGPQMWCTHGWYQRCLICNVFLDNYHKVRKRKTRFAFFDRKAGNLVGMKPVFHCQNRSFSWKIGILWQICPFWINLDEDSLHRVCSNWSWNSPFVTVVARTWRVES